MSLSEPLVILDGLLQRAGNTTVKANRVALGEPVTIQVTGDFTMTNSVHRLQKGTPGGGYVNVDNIFGAEPGEILFLFGDGVRLRNNGNMFLPGNFKLDLGNTILLYWTGSLGVWAPMSYV